MGRFFVLDGVDLAGKATQTKLLIERLRLEGRRVETIDFPQYTNNFMGKLIGECMAGDHGDFISINPKIVSVLYAADRFESSKKIEQWLSEGIDVIADRYVSSNQIHQGAKILDNTKRKEFLLWLDQLEFGVFKIPRPDAIVYLDRSIESVLRIMKEKAGSLAVKKAYLQGKTDQAESNPEHLVAARESGMKLITEMDNWVRIQCEENGELRSPKDIHQEVYSAIANFLTA